MAANCMSFGSDLVLCSKPFLQDQAKEVTWLGTDGPPGACFTTKHHSLVTYGGRGMVQQQQKRYHGYKLQVLIQIWMDALKLLTGSIQKSEVQVFSCPFDFFHVELSGLCSG
jgi:hypothetical protein